MAVPYKLNYFEIETGIDSTSTLIHSGDLTANKIIKIGGTSNDILLGNGTTASLSGLQPTGNYITALTGEATATGPGSVAITLTNSAVIGKLLTGLSITGSTIAATDTILQAFGKVQNQINGKQDAIILTTTGTSGAATLIANTLNIPQYTDAFVGTVTSVSALTLGTTGTDLSSTVANGTTTPVITLNVPTASAANRGALSSTDWTTFNSKQDAGNYITSLTGEATASGPGAASVTLSNTAVIGKVLTGLNVTGGTVISTDTILAAFGKVQNQINGLVGGSIFQGTWDASTNTPALASSVGTNGYYYIVSVDGSTNLNGITDWKVGDWAIFAGTAWQKVDNTDSVASVNGYTGTVSLVTGDVLEGAGSLPSRPSQLYFTDARARAAISLTTSGSSGASTYDSATGVLNIPNYLQDLSGYVTLNTAQTITAAKTFSTSGNSDTLIINHSSGSGIALNITKGGNGEGIYVNKTSGSGNAVTIIGTLNATTLVKSGGTSSQFLKADGTVDSTAYGTGSVTSVAALTLGTTGTDLSSTVANGTTTPVITLNVPTASATNRGALSSADWTTFNSKQATITLTTTGSSGAATFIANTLNVPDYGSALSGYLPLTGGTLLTTNTTETLRIVNAGTGYGLFVQSDSFFQGDVTFQSGFKSTTNTFTLPSATGTLALTSDLSGYLPLSGGTLTGALSGTSASFSGNGAFGGSVALTGIGGGISINNATTSGIQMRVGGNIKGYCYTTNTKLILEAATSVGIDMYVNSNGSPSFTIASTGAATFTGTTGDRLTLYNSGNNSVINGLKIDSDIYPGITFNARSSTGGAVIGGGKIVYNSVATGYGAASLGGAILLQADNAMQFSTGGDNVRLTIASGGNVIVGGTTAGTILNTSITVNNATAANFAGFIPMTANTERGYFAGSSAGLEIGVAGSGTFIIYTSATERMRIASNGGVQSTPAVGSNAFIASVSGSSIAYLTSLASTSDFSGYWQVAGNFAGSISHPTTTSTNYNTTSDYRLKENIKPLTDGLEAILKLKPVTGNYKSDLNKTNMPMFLAHEVQEVVPIAVTGQKDAIKFNKLTEKEEIDIQQLDAAKLIPHMVRAIQELKAEIDLLKGIAPIEPETEAIVEPTEVESETEAQAEPENEPETEPQAEPTETDTETQPNN
jgi:hypothetical protein